MPTEATAQPISAESDRALARLKRIASPEAHPSRPSGDRDREALRRRRHGAGKRGGLQLGWAGWLMIELAAVAVVAAAVLVWPPTSACRDQEAKMGFYAGDTLGKCIRRGVAARIEAIDQSVKMAVRGSGK